MKPSAFALIFLLLLINSPFAQAQDSLFIGGATLRLGMTRDTVSSLLRTTYDLRRIEGSGDGWMIVRRAAPSDSPGSLTFETDRLIGISKDWGNFRGPEAVRLGEVLHAVISGTARGDVSVAVVETKSRREPQIAVRQVNLIFGEKTLSLLVIEYPTDVPVVVLTESVSQQRPR